MGNTKRADRCAAIRELARTRFHDAGTLEIDDNARTSETRNGSEGADGAYVQVWIWVDFTGTDLSRDKT